MQLKETIRSDGRNRFVRSYRPATSLTGQQWYPLLSIRAPQLHVVVQLEKAIGKPKRRKDANLKSQEWSANTSDVGIALSQATASLTVVERRRAASLAVGAFSSRY